MKATRYYQPREILALVLNQAKVKTLFFILDQFWNYKKHFLPFSVILGISWM